MFASSLTLTNNNMTLSEKISSNPFLKVSNCTDISDLEFAMDELRKLDLEFGAEKKTLLNLWAKFLDKKNRLGKEEDELIRKSIKF
jgi:hypothetical protein